MKEPIYSYVKGKGWLINPYPKITMKCGMMVTIEPRVPLRGEAYSYAHKQENTVWTPEGVLDLEYWARKYTNEKYRYLSVWTEINEIKEDRHYVTFVKHE